jgi:hypothetical protein
LTQPATTAVYSADAQPEPATKEDHAMTYASTSDLQRAMEYEIRQRTKVEPHCFRGLFEGQALPYWLSTGLPAKQIILQTVVSAREWPADYSAR